MCVRIEEPTCINQTGVCPPNCVDKSVEADPFVQVADITFYGHG